MIESNIADAQNFEERVAKELEEVMDYCVQMLALKEYVDHRRISLDPISDLYQYYLECHVGCPPGRLPTVMQQERTAVNLFLEYQLQEQKATCKYLDYIELGDVQSIINLLDRLAKLFKISLNNI